MQRFRASVLPFLDNLQQASYHANALCQGNVPDPGDIQQRQIAVSTRVCSNAFQIHLLKSVSSTGRSISSLWQQHRSISQSACLHGPRTIGYPLAQTGEGISECELIQWFVEEGAIVREFDKLCEVQSDKASVEISSRFDAKVTKMHFKKGDIVKVGATLVDLEVADGVTLPPDMASLVLGADSTAASTPPAPASPPTPSPTPPKAPPAAAPATLAAAAAAPVSAAAEVAAEVAADVAAVAAGAFSGVLSSPAVRRIARESKVDLTRVTGSGPSGRILEEDIRRYLAAQVAQPTTAPTAQPTQPAPPTPAPPARALPALGTASPDTVLPVRGYRRAMIRTMTAVATVPHFHLHDEAFVDTLLAVRKALGTDTSLHGTKLTMLPFIIKALSLVISDHPLLNASLAADGSAITLHGAHNIGVAMATAHGLVVPNIKQVQQLSVAQVAQEVARLQAGALAGRLATEDVTGGTFTISNIGSIGGLFANPLVNPPEVAILAIGRVRQVPHASSHPTSSLSHVAHVAGSCSTQHVLGMSWGADHRVVDGAALAHASNALRGFLEHPERMLLRTA